MFFRTETTTENKTPSATLALVLQVEFLRVVRFLRPPAASS